MQMNTSWTSFRSTLFTISHHGPLQDAFLCSWRTPLCHVGTSVAKWCQAGQASRLTSRPSEIISMTLTKGSQESVGSLGNLMLTNVICFSASLLLEIPRCGRQRSSSTSSHVGDERRWDAQVVVQCQSNTGRVWLTYGNHMKPPLWK